VRFVSQLFVSPSVSGDADNWPNYGYI